MQTYTMTHSRDSYATKLLISAFCLVVTFVCTLLSSAVAHAATVPNPPPVVRCLPGTSSYCREPLASAVLEVTPKVIAPGSAVTVGWNSTNAVHCAGGGFDTKGQTSGLVRIPRVSTSTEFTLTCASNILTLDRAVAFVKVNKVCTPKSTRNPSAVFSSVPRRGEYLWGSMLTLNLTVWNVSADYFCYADVASGSYAGANSNTVDDYVEGSFCGTYQTASPPPRYSFTCDLKKSLNKTFTTKRMGGPAQPVLTSDRRNINIGEAVNLTWSAPGYDVCQIFPEYGSFDTQMATSGTRRIKPPLAMEPWTKRAVGYVLECRDRYEGAGVDMIDIGITGVLEPRLPNATITANPAIVAPGQKTTVTWDSGDADACTGYGFDTGGATSGTTQVVVDYSKTYYLFCDGAGGTGVHKADVSVDEPGTPKIDFWTDTSIVLLGRSAVLHWAVSDAEQCSSTNFRTGGKMTGSQQVYPAQSTAYTLACISKKGKIASRTVVVATRGEAATGIPIKEPIVRFTTDKASVAAGESATLTWSSTLSTVCIGSGFSTGGRTQGTATVSPTTATTYRILCQGDYVASKSLIITIKGVDSNPTASLVADPAVIASGGNATLRWSSTNSSSCTSPDFATDGYTRGEFVVRPNITTTYTVNCEGPGGKTSAQATVSIPGVPAVTLTASPSTVVEGSTSTLTWKSTNSTSCIGSSFLTNGLANGSSVVTPTKSTTYTVTCTNVAGVQVSDTATVTVTPYVDIENPTQPSALTATAESSSRIDLTWEASTDNMGVTGYHIERCAGLNCTTFTEIASVTGDTLQYSNTGLPASILHRYRIRARDAVGNFSLYSAIVRAKTLAPAPVVSFTALPSTIKVGSSTTLEWSSTNSTGCISPDFTTNNAVRGTKVLKPSSTKTYTVTCGGSGGSTTKSVSVTVEEVVAPPVLEFSAVVVGGSQVNLYWVFSGAPFSIERCTGATCRRFAVIGTDTASPYNDIGLTKNTTYRYRMRTAQGNLSVIKNATTYNY